ncbi:MAG TPA: hypothetical protein PLY19_13185 [Rhodoglobus sp.]|nr:hypothetical protein [Rhodoglobus sp.]
MMSSRSARVARGSIAAAFATTVALFSHVFAGGAMPGLLGLVVPLVLSVMVCALLAGRRLSLVRLSIAVTLSQLLFHTLFVLGAPHAAVTATPGHHMTGMVLPAVAGGQHTMTDPVLMWVGHAIAAAITIAALYNAERVVVALATLVERFRIWWGSVTTPTATTWARRSTAPTGTTLTLPQLRLDSDSAPRRGPPVLLAH